RRVLRRGTPTHHPLPILTASLPKRATRPCHLCAESVPSVRPHHGLPLRRTYFSVRQPRCAIVPGRDRVLHEVLVVALGKVRRPRVSTARLLARDTCLKHAGAEVEQIAELDRLGQVAVEDGA